MLPIILSCPHAQSEITDPDIRQRIRLDDYELWKGSDPFTDEENTKEFTCVARKHFSPSHRFVCDQNRPPTVEDNFRTHDFFGRQIFYDGEEFTREEKEHFLEQYWHSHHNEIIESVKSLDRQGFPFVLIMDYHNASNDHPLSDRGEYMSSMVLSNRDRCEKYTYPDNHLDTPVTIPTEYLKVFGQDLADKLPLSMEYNYVHQGGHNIQWFQQLNDTLEVKAKIYSFQLEYNLDHVANPLSRKCDMQALHILQEALNQSLIDVCEYMMKLEGVRGS